MSLPVNEFPPFFALFNDGCSPSSALSRYNFADGKGCGFWRVDARQGFGFSIRPPTNHLLE